MPRSLKKITYVHDWVKPSSIFCTIATLLIMNLLRISLVVDRCPGRALGEGNAALWACPGLTGYSRERFTLSHVMM